MNVERLDSIEIIDKNILISSIARRLKNAIKRMPILPPSVRILDTKVVVRTVEDNEYKFELDLDLPDKDNVRKIWECLYESEFPTLTITEKHEEPCSNKERQAMIDAGAEFDIALTATKTVIKSTEYKIKSVTFKKDELLLKSLEDGEEIIYTMNRMPVGVFLKRMRENNYEENSLGEFLMKKASHTKTLRNNIKTTEGEHK